LPRPGNGLRVMGSHKSPSFQEELCQGQGGAFPEVISIGLEGEA